MCEIYRAVSTTSVDKLRLDISMRKYKTTSGDNLISKGKK